MSAESILVELDQLLVDEQRAIRELDANLTSAYAQRKLQLFQELKEAAKDAPELHDQVLLLARRARQNAMLLAFARDCLRDAMGSVARHLNARKDITNLASTSGRKGLRVSMTG